MDECKPLLHGLRVRARVELGVHRHRRHHALHHQGKAVQVDPIKPALKPPGTKRLKLKCDRPLSSFAFTFNLRCYIKLTAELAMLHFRNLSKEGPARSDQGPVN